MFRKTYKVVVLAIVLGVLLNACSKRQAVTEEYNTISDLAYSEKCKIEPIIYIEEKTGFVPYIVLTNDYNGKTLLLRRSGKAGKDLLPPEKRRSINVLLFRRSFLPSVYSTIIFFLLLK